MHSGEFADVYVLANSRSSILINKFLTHFLSNRKEMASEYEIPQYSENPKLVFKKDSELMKYCETNEEAVQTIYYENTDETIEPSFGMIFYTNDKNMILGLSIKANTKENDYLKKLKEFLNCEIGLIQYEKPAPNNSKLFIELYNDFDDLK